MTVELKDVDMKIINRGVIAIILSVVAVFLSMFEYAMDYVRDYIQFSNIIVLIADLIVNFLLLSTIYYIVRGSTVAYKFAVAVLFLSLLGYIYETTLEIFPAILLVAIVCINLYIFLSQPMRGWCIPPKEKKTE